MIRTATSAAPAPAPQKALRRPSAARVMREYLVTGIDPHCGPWSAYRGWAHWCVEWHDFKGRGWALTATDNLPGTGARNHFGADRYGEQRMEWHDRARYERFVAQARAHAAYIGAAFSVNDCGVLTPEPKPAGTRSRKAPHKEERLSGDR